MNCIGCPYSYIDISKGIPIPQINTGYCELGFPQECVEGRLPRDLTFDIDNNK